jgi:hypothetical protein
MDMVRNIFYGKEKMAVMAATENAGSQFLGGYPTEREGHTAIRLICERLEHNDVVYMPTPGEVKARISLEEQKKYGIHGKKQKGHGGS